MVSIEKAWARSGRQLGGSQDNYRLLVYLQTFQLAANNASTGLRQDFPNGALILGINASAVPSTPAAPDSVKYRGAFGLNFAYSGSEQLTPGGPILADALLGSGEHSQFPVKEIVVAPNQGIICTAQNYTSTALLIHVAYHSLVRRL